MKNIFDLKSLPLPLLVPMARPSSYSMLPRMAIPTRSEVDRVEELKRNLAKEAGFTPGDYFELTTDLVSKVEAVYDGLMNALLEELTGADAYHLCVRLYERNEEYLGYIFSAHHDLAAQRMLLGSTQSPMQNQMLMERLSPYTESIRWLIEIVLKYCEMQGQRVGNAKFDRLIELARALFEWDLVWEQIHRRVVHPHLVIGLDFSARPHLTNWGAKVIREYNRALMPSVTENENAEFDRFQNSNSHQSPKQACENIVETLHSMGLDEPLLQERGYSLSDWGKFSLGLLDSFSRDEYRRVCKLTTLENFLEGTWNLDRQRLPHLLGDYALSKQTVRDIDMKKFRPVEYGRRDTRLLRRPLVILERQDSIRCLYGVETIHRGMLLILERLESGRIDLLRQTKNKKVSRALGHLQKELGDIFEKDIEDECKAHGYECSREKKGVKGKRIPQKSGFGPVDVFIIDRDQRRFVLVEAKNVADEGTLPREMSREREQFSGYIEKLNLQVAWFSQHLSDLKRENGVSSEEEYSIEGVIVVNKSRPWVFASDQPVPILDFPNFFKRLKRGKTFTIDPVEA